MLLVLVLTLLITTPTTAFAAVKISKAKATMEVDSTLKLSISATSKVVWTTSKKSIATVNSSGVITAKSEGKATITGKINATKYTCAVTVVNSNKSAPKVSIKSADEFKNYLNETYSSVETDMGVMKLTHDVYMNDYDTFPYDYSISTGWDGFDPYDIEHSISYTDTQKENTKKKLREIQKKIYNDFTKYFPDKKVSGGFLYWWYKYPNILEGYMSIHFLTWCNYEDSGDFPPYKTSKISEFHWVPDYDDYDFTK
jgi:hypothetical protein